MLDKVELFEWLIYGLLGATIGFCGYILYLCWKKRIALVKIEDGAVSPASIQAYVLLVATFAGGLWAAFTISVSGALQLQRLELDERRYKSHPEPLVELQADSFSPISENGRTLVPVRFLVSLENPGPRTISDIRFDEMPMLSYVKVEGRDPEKQSYGAIKHLKRIKVECNALGPCTLGSWSWGTMVPGAKGRMTFLHPGMEPGIYYVQFQLPVPDSTQLGKDVQKKAPKRLLWTRSTFIEVRAENPPSIEVEHRPVQGTVRSLGGKPPAPAP